MRLTLAIIASLATATSYAQYPIIQRLNSEINAILRDPAVKSALNVQGFDLIGGTPENFEKLIRSESEKWAPVIRKTGVRID